MTNLKKLGLTAIAGSLVATTGYAGSLDVSGAAKVSYNAKDTSETTGNPFSMTRDITFSGSGEMDNGMTISYFQLLSAGAFSSSGLTLDMGDAGSATFMNGTSGGHGISAYEDKMPTAGEQVWDDLDGEANGVLTGNKTNKIGYGTSFAGANVSVDYNKQQDGGSGKSIAIDFAPMDGAMIFVAQSDEYAGVNSSTDQVTFGGTYTSGAVTAGVQMTSIDKSAVNSDQDRTHIAASFAVNEDLSVSYGMSTVEFEDGSKTDQEDSGFSASYTMGSLSLNASFNSSDNVGGTSGTDDEMKEIGLAFAF
ncbi:porin [Candidatus Pelagibacter sp.]|nr:porin [Candidatus Pelagibacter sp.]